MTPVLVILVVMLVVVVVVVVRATNIGDLASLVKEIDVLGKGQVVVPHYQPGQYEYTREPAKNYLADFFPLRGGELPPDSAKGFRAE